VLTGPGASDAARGLLVTTLLAAAHQSAAPRMVMTHTDLAVLAGTTAVKTAGLEVVETIDDALAVLGPTGASAQAGRAPCLLLVEPLRGPDQHRLEQAITVSTAVTAVVLGASPPLPAWHVGADGTVLTASDRARRLCVLNSRATADLLSLLPPAAAESPLHRRPSPTDTPADHRVAALLTGNAAPRTARPISLVVLGPCRVARTTSRSRCDAPPRYKSWSTWPYTATARSPATSPWPSGPACPPPPSPTGSTPPSAASTSHWHPAAGSSKHVDGRYRLNPDLITVDLWDVQTAVQAAITAQPGNPPLYAVVNRNHGELAAGHTWPWLPPHREAIRRDIIDAYIELADSAQTDEALNLVRQALTVEPKTQP
jgi:hypothetical protein